MTPSAKRTEVIVVLAGNRALPMTSEKWVAVGVDLKVIWEQSDKGVLRGISSRFLGVGAISRNWVSTSLSYPLHLVSEAAMTAD